MVGGDCALAGAGELGTEALGNRVPLFCSTLGEGRPFEHANGINQFCGWL